MTSEGFGYFYIKAGEGAIKECVSFNKFNGLELMSPHSGQSYEVEVKAGSSAIIMYKMTSSDGFSMQSSTTVQVLLDSGML